MTTQPQLLTNLEAPDRLPVEMSKSQYAKHCGVTPGRVSQMVAAGMPTLANGRVSRQAADEWQQANVRHRTSSARAEAFDLASVKREREEAQRDLLMLQVAEKEGRMIDRKAVEVAIFDRARSERDAHLAWVSRISPVLASEFGLELSAVYAFMDKAMREHLQEIADTPLDRMLSDG